MAIGFKTPSPRLQPFDFTKVIITNKETSCYNILKKIERDFQWRIILLKAARGVYIALDKDQYAHGCGKKHLFPNFMLFELKSPTK